MSEKSYNERLEDWKKQFKADWDYNRKLVVFKDGNGTLYTPTTTTTTTTTAIPTTAPVQNVSSSPVVIINITSTTPRAEGVATGESTDLLRLIGITVGVLLCFLIIAGFFILMCRWSRKRKNRNVSVRRPLEGPEPEDHIYAEIEPLQSSRADDPGGASGTTSDIPLPARKRRRGISSFSGLSTRIQKFFSIRKSVDNQSVFYKRNGESGIQTVTEAPEPPERNLNGNRRDKGRKVQRFESTASRRPLLDGDSQVSQPSTSSVELRNSTYNALIKTEDGRASGPYDTLNRVKSNTEEAVEADPPSSPHDYFTLEKNKFPIDEDSPVYHGGSEIGAMEHDVGNMETIEEADAENDGEPVQPHDYFVLEPHEREKSKRGKSTDNKSTDDKDGQSSKPVEEDVGIDKVPSTSDKSKPTPKPRLNKPQSGETSPNHDGETNTVESESKGAKMNEYIAYSAMSGGSTSKEDDYEISKLGEAPRPPEQSEKDQDNELEEDNDYLKPVEEKARVYVDVFPNPPPRTTSLLHDSTTELHQKDLLPKTKDSPSSLVSSPSKSTGSPVRRRGSPSKSPSKSPTIPKHSPTKSVGSTKSSPNSSPTKTLDSPVKSAVTPPRSEGSPVKVQGTPEKSVNSPKGSPTKTVGSPVKRMGDQRHSITLASPSTKSTETEV